MRLITQPKITIENIKLYSLDVPIAGRQQWDHIIVDFDDYKDKSYFLMLLYFTPNQHRKLDTFIIDNYKFHGLFPVLLTDGLKNCTLAFDHCEKLI